ncbi:MAG TPA: TetR family transcriptional regulator [Curvibacter sp.]|nr:TetR family transcriptional regulator [Curvibacter sp.]|tara:strand:- start:1865 stop:2620 length:756 start_codon:yes stop_codon:yes gene_type:complete
MPVVPLAPKTPRSGARTAARDGRALHKGQQTKLAIIDAALGLAAQIGLEGLSIGVLAEVTGMSKSGVFAHFGSREELQISVIREYFARFEQEIFYPALENQRGLPRLQALFSNWMKRVTVEIQSGCIFISGAVDFDDRPGPVRDALASSVKIWLAAVQRAVVQAKEEGQLAADADENQICFEIHGLILAVHYEARFLKTPGSIARANKAFEQILARYGADGKPVKTLTSKAANVKAARKTASKTLTPSKQE